MFGHDQLLTEEQANELINELARQRAGAGRKKRAGNALYSEGPSTKRWDPSRPIPYMFDQSLGEFELDMDLDDQRGIGRNGNKSQGSGIRWRKRRDRNLILMKEDDRSLEKGF